MDAKFEIEAICGSQFINNLAKVEENPSVQFMKGLSTSAFSAAKATNVVINTLGNEEQLTSLANTIVASTKDFAEKQLTDLAKRKKEELTNKAVSLSTYYTSRVAYWTKEYMQEEMQKAMSQFSTDLAKENEKKAEKEDQAQTKNTINDIKNKAAEFTGKASQVTQTIEKNIIEISNNITAGPAWIEKNIQKTLKKTLNSAENELDLIVEKTYASAEEFFDNKAKAQGKKAAAKTAEATAKKIKKGLTEADKAKKTAISFAKSALQLIKQKALALIGM